MHGRDGVVVSAAVRFDGSPEQVVDQLVKCIVVAAAQWEGACLLTLDAFRYGRERWCRRGFSNWFRAKGCECTHCSASARTQWVSPRYMRDVPIAGCFRTRPGSGTTFPQVNP